MAWRFQPSKYKNTTPKQPKKEDIIYDLPIGNLSCTNNGIQSSPSLLAFHIEGDGGKLGILPTNARGRYLRKDISIVCAHSELIDDFAFLPFADRRLLTCSRDDKLKLWRFDDENANLPTMLSDPFQCIDLGRDRLLECLACHSIADGIVAVGSGDGAMIVDLEKGRMAMDVNGMDEKVQSVAWSADGCLLALSSDKGRSAGLFDSRASSVSIAKTSLHNGQGREGRVIFLGDSGKLLSAGFTAKRCQEIRIFDVRQFAQPLHVQEFDPSTGLLIPLYDADTKLIFLAGKGTNKLVVGELCDKAPLFSYVFEHSLSEQILGGCILAKSQMDVMSGEVQRFYQLAKSAIYPISCSVPRRTYRDFHADLYPDTIGTTAGCTAQEWLGGSNNLPGKISMAPKNQLTATSVVAETIVSNGRQHDKQKPESTSTIHHQPTFENGLHAKKLLQKHDDASNCNTNYQQQQHVSKIDNQIVPIIHDDVTTITTNAGEPTHITMMQEQPIKYHHREPQPQQQLVPMRAANPTVDNLRSRDPRPVSIVVGVVQSKYRHVETIPGGKDTTFTNLRRINTRLPTESNGFCVSANWAAIPLTGPGGVVAILDLSKPEKLTDGVMPGLENKTNVTDIVWNPFNADELAVACDNGIVNLWHIPSDGVQSLDLQPISTLKVCNEKILSIRYHPLADQVLAIAVQSTVEVWHIGEQKCRLRLCAHSQPILSIAWSANGRRLATVARDGRICVFEPQLGENCLVAQSTPILESNRGARILFACDDEVLLLVNFSRSSARQLSLYAIGSDQSIVHVHTTTVDTSPQMLIPHYDYDSSVVTLTGKGDRYIHMYEVAPEHPFLMPLSPWCALVGHQAFSLQSKNLCDIRNVEFQRGWRLTEKSIEFLSFRVPRVKKDVFQSDIFPDSLVTWQSCMTAEQWFSGDKRYVPVFRSLRPDGMNDAIVAAPPSASLTANRPKANSVGTEDNSSKHIIQETSSNIRSDDDDRRKELQASWSQQIVVDRRLEQDNMEGVDESEW